MPRLVRRATRAFLRQASSSRPPENPPSGGHRGTDRAEQLSDFFLLFSIEAEDLAQVGIIQEVEGVNRALGWRLVAWEVRIGGEEGAMRSLSWKSLYAGVVLLSLDPA
jgi:hypothetical protein